VQAPALVNVTGNPEDAVAATVNVLPYTALEGGGVVKVMVCDCINVGEVYW
jgi:hypothetical protein